MLVTIKNRLFPAGLWNALEGLYFSWPNKFKQVGIYFHLIIYCLIHRLVAVHFRQDDVTLMNISVQIYGWMVRITDNEKENEALCNLRL